MNTAGASEPKKARWKRTDPRLLRAARRLIRLYDLEETALFKVNPESVADVIAQELNRDPDETNR